MSANTPSNKSTKKVSRACNTCRLKRKRCDGLAPCEFCKSAQVECSYSREPRRRGPPSGYLRYTETRVSILETLLGLYLQTAGPHAVEALVDAARKLASEVTTRTQDVWDAYKQTWSDTDAARTTNELVAAFAPFTPAPDQMVGAKPLLPLPLLSGKTSSSPLLLPPNPSQPPQPKHLRSPSPFPTSGVSAYTNESFERHQPTHTGPSQIREQFQEPSLMDLDTPVSPTDSAQLGPTSSLGAYWRTAAPQSPSPLDRTSPPTEARPPPHVRTALMATYRDSVHPSLPIISPRQIADKGSALDGTPMLLFAFCAYTARLVSPAASRIEVDSDSWYESAFALLHVALRRPAVDVDVVQTIVLLALCDLGRGRDVLAWRSVGVAIRAGVELGLDGVRPNFGKSRSGTSNRGPSSTAIDPEDSSWTKGLWGVVSLLDLLLSMQLGRSPGTSDALRHASAKSNTPKHPPSPPLSSMEIASTFADNDEGPSLFAHTRDLLRIVARIYFYVGLGYADPPAPNQDAIDICRAELVAWHDGLPSAFRLTLGGERVPKAVLEAHMLYQIALGLLARAASEDADRDLDIESASTFNLLLDKYRSSLADAGPHVVWLVFAAALMSIRRSDGMPGNARARQTQLYLLNCRDALGALGDHWLLALRCTDTLEQLMDGAGDQSKGAGKRKRKEEEESSGHVVAGERRGVRVGQPELNGLAMGFVSDVPELNDTTRRAGVWDGMWDERLWGRSG
ncbi:Nitrogen assimilation transcriptional factor nira [Mycena chlorophos]|uniref:Nitrogen assimilation transcriptional factor nira n=1 Tax=Mycena chlorophos TaxID=658473 RepID=A0A8H6TAC4_MYCCL|nr:Nitrogen assimilation transcriptional factor nira [Mycena chlorophos]